jgi:hypothetical protein
MNGLGGMATVELAMDLAGCRRVLERVRLFTLAESLGGTDSLIEHPAIMTHGSVPVQQRRAWDRRQPRVPVDRYRGCRRREGRSRARADSDQLNSEPKQLQFLGHSDRIDAASRAARR